MEILGYIVTKTKVDNILPCIKVVSSYRLVEDKSKPILLIGLEEARKQASSFSILEKRLSDNMFWTFGKRERRNDYERDINLFQEYVLKRSLYEIKYYYFNIILTNGKKVRKLLQIIKNDEKKVFYFAKNMVYMYYQHYVLGVSLEILDYIGVKRNKIIELVKSNDKNVIFFNDFALCLKMKEVTNEKKYITPYFLSLNAE